MAAVSDAVAATGYPEEAFTLTPKRLIATALAYPKEPACRYFAKGE